jgi:uncharacterized protein involved in exopolysaccharide biosynthesis
MNQNINSDFSQLPPGLYSREQIDDEINLIDLIYPVYKRWKFLVIFCFLVVLATAALTWRSPKVYEARAVILPETSAISSGSELKAVFMEQFGIAGIGDSTGTPSEIFEAIIKSSELARKVLERYDYFSIAGVKKSDEESVVKSFADNIEVSKDRSAPTLSVSLQDNDPVSAADLVNSYIIALDAYNRDNTVTSARRLRIYIEERLNASNQELEQAQQELREFQEENRAISISKQADATLEVLSEMEAQRVNLEVEMAAKESFYKGPHMEIEQLKAQMEALQKNIDQLTYSTESEVPIELDKGKVEFYIPLKKIPALNFDESRLLLKVKAKTGVVTMLTTQLEQAKLDETKDMPTINVLEWAVPPEFPIKPKLKLNIVLSLVVSFFLGIFLIFLKEFFSRMDQDPESSPKWREMKKGLKGIVPFIKKDKAQSSI